MAAALDDELDRLYSLRPEEFVAERDALAKRLRAEKDREGSEAVKAARRPTVAAWAVNQLVRAEGEAVRDLVQVGERLRAMQQRALEGDAGATRELRELTAKRRAAVAALAERALRLLGEAGYPATGATGDAVNATLDAVVADPDAAEAVLGGQLVKELEPEAGFGGLLDVAAPRSEREPPAEPTARERRRAARAQRRDRPTAAAGGSEQQRRALDDARARAAEAADEAHAAVREVAAARNEVSRLQDALVTANGRLRQAEERARMAQWRASQAQQEVDGAERALREAGE